MSHIEDIFLPQFVESRSRTKDGGMEYIVTPRQIGLTIRERRRERGLTQEELAEAAHVSRTFVIRLEKGMAAALYPEKLIAVLDALGLRLALVGEGSDRPRESGSAQPSGRCARESTADRDRLVREALDSFSLDSALLAPRRQGSPSRE